MQDLRTNGIFNYKNYHFYNLFNYKSLLESFKKEIKNEKFLDNPKDYMYDKKLCFVYLTLRNIKDKHFRLIINNCLLNYLEILMISYLLKELKY